MTPTQNLELIPRKVKPYFNEKSRQNTKESMDFRSYYVYSGLLCKGIPTSIESQALIGVNIRKSNLISRLFEHIKEVKPIIRSKAAPKGASPKKNPPNCDDLEGFFISKNRI